MIERRDAAREGIETPMPVAEYARLREKLLDCIGKTGAIRRGCNGAVAELREKVETNAFNLVVVGQFKRGKTHLINALMGADILPVSVIPLTSIVTVMSYGEKLRIRVFFNDGGVADIGHEALAEYVTESGNPNNRKNVKEVVVNYPSLYLRDGVRLIDTPGVGSVYLHNTDMAYLYLPKSDAALFVLSVDQPVGKAEIDFLADVRQYSHRIFFLLNKIDYLTKEETEESIEFARQTLGEILGPEVKVYPVSARLALQGKLEGSAEMLKASNILAFSEVLDEFLLREKGKVLLASVAGNLLRRLSQCRLEIELEMQSMRTPLEDLKEKISSFHRRKEEVLAEKESFDVLLEAEVDRLIVKKLDEDLVILKKELIPRMENGFERFHDEHRELSLKELNDALEGYVTEEIEKAFTVWYEAEDGKLSNEFESICSRFVEKVNKTEDELMQYSSRLFSIPFEVSRAESKWTAESGFYFKLKGEAVGLDMLTDSLTQVVPGYVSNRYKKIKDFLYRIANRTIVGKRRRHMLESIEMQSGRVRFDFLDRISKSRLRFRAEMMKRIQATVTGIGTAIEMGVDMKSRGEKKVEELVAAHSEDLAAIDRVREELSDLRETLDAV